jgi:hypothetical protein
MKHIEVEKNIIEDEKSLVINYYIIKKSKREREKNTIYKYHLKERT